MRDDLLDSQASVDWAETQIPLLAERFAALIAREPFALKTEVDSVTGDYLVVAYELGAPTLSLNAWTGSIINAIRSGLDLLAASLAARNGRSPDEYTNFPIYRSFDAMNEPGNGLNAKRWLSNEQRSIIETLKPYKGGHAHLFVLHQLDIPRKHKRLLALQPTVAGFLAPDAHRGGSIQGGTRPVPISSRPRKV